MSLARLLRSEEGRDMVRRWVGSSDSSLIMSELKEDLFRSVVATPPSENMHRDALKYAQLYGSFSVLELLSNAKLYAENPPEELADLESSYGYEDILSQYSGSQLTNEGDVIDGN